MKVEVPSQATPETEWQIARLSPQRYYQPVPAKRNSWDEPGMILYKEAMSLENEEQDTDVFVLRQKKMVAVTPLHLDMTARTNFKDFDAFLRK